MQTYGFLEIGAVVLALFLPGCRLPNREGPVPKQLATCRRLSQLGVAAIERGKWDEAEKLLARAIETCPADPEARRHYAEALWRRGARREAVSQLEEAARLADGDAALHVRIADMRLAMGQMEPARRQAEQALDLDPKLSAAWGIRGRVMQTAGNTQQALADCHRALAYAPNDRATLLEIAELYRELDRPQRALAVLHNLADSYAPGEEPQQVLYLTGLAYMALERYDDAAESFSTAVVRGTPKPEIFYRLATAEFFAGRPTKAATAAQRALALDPQHPASHELLNRLELVGQVEAPSRR